MTHARKNNSQTLGCGKDDREIRIQFLAVSKDYSLEFLNVTNEMQLLKTLLSSLLYMFRALLAHHQELTKTVGAAYSDGMR